MTFTTHRSFVGSALIVALAGMGVPTAFAVRVEAAPPETPRAGEDEARERNGSAPELLRPIRIAVFDVDVLGNAGIEGPAASDQIHALLAGLPQVTLVNRDQLHRVAEEHQIALSGLVETASAVRLGRFLSAQYVVAGRASGIGPWYYLVLKIVDVETTEQTTVSARAPVERGFEAVLRRLEEPLTANVRRLQQPVPDPADEALAELRRLARPLADKVVLVSIEEAHLDRPLDDPAAQMAVMQRLGRLGLSAIAPQEPVAGWKESLLQTGRYGDRKVDYLLEGEGTSAFAAQLHGLVSCRARVELRLVPLPGRGTAVSERGVAAGIDLIEAFAAKTALEEAATQACDAIITQYVRMKHGDR